MTGWNAAERIYFGFFYKTTKVWPEAVPAIFHVGFIGAFCTWQSLGLWRFNWAVRIWGETTAEFFPPKSRVRPSLRPVLRV
jgi:hypothetical protein